MDEKQQNMGSNLFHGAALAIMLIGFGLFLTFGTFGFMAIIGIPVMFVGLYVGAMEVFDGARGRNWYGRRQRSKPAME